MLCLYQELGIDSREFLERHLEGALLYRAVRLHLSLELCSVFSHVMPHGNAFILLYAVILLPHLKGGGMEGRDSLWKNIILVYLDGRYM